MEIYLLKTWIPFKQEYNISPGRYQRIIQHSTLKLEPEWGNGHDKKHAIYEVSQRPKDRGNFFLFCALDYYSYNSEKGQETCLYESKKANEPYPALIFYFQKLTIVLWRNGPVELLMESIDPQSTKPKIEWSVKLKPFVVPLIPALTNCQDYFGKLGEVRGHYLCFIHCTRVQLNPGISWIKKPVYHLSVIDLTNYTDFPSSPPVPLYTISDIRDFSIAPGSKPRIYCILRTETEDILELRYGGYTKRVAFSQRFFMPLAVAVSHKHVLVGGACSKSYRHKYLLYDRKMRQIPEPGGALQMSVMIGDDVSGDINLRTVHSVRLRNLEIFISVNSLNGISIISANRNQLCDLCTDKIGQFKWKKDINGIYLTTGSSQYRSRVSFIVYGKAIFNKVTLNLA